MAQNYTCDRCEKRITGYSDTFNHIKFQSFVSGKGVVTYEKDLCDECMIGLIDYIENPKKEETK